MIKFDNFKINFVPFKFFVMICHYLQKLLKNITLTREFLVYIKIKYNILLDVMFKELYT